MGFFGEFGKKLGFGSEPDAGDAHAAATAEAADETFAEIEQTDREEATNEIQGMEMAPGQVVEPDAEAKNPDEFEQIAQAGEASEAQLAESREEVAKQAAEAAEYDAHDVVPGDDEALAEAKANAPALENETTTPDAPTADQEAA
jgi:hypothetical protein